MEKKPFFTNKSRNLRACTFVIYSSYCWKYLSIYTLIGCYIYVYIVQYNQRANTMSNLIVTIITAIIDYSDNKMHSFMYRPHNV